MSKGGRVVYITVQCYCYLSHLTTALPGNNYSFTNICLCKRSSLVNASNLEFIDSFQMRYEFLPTNSALSF